MKVYIVQGIENESDERGLTDTLYVGINEDVAMMETMQGYEKLEMEVWNEGKLLEIKEKVANKPFKVVFSVEQTLLEKIGNDEKKLEEMREELHRIMQLNK